MARKQPISTHDLRAFREAALDLALETAQSEKQVGAHAKVFERYLRTGYVGAVGGCSKRPNLDRALQACRLDGDNPTPGQIVAVAVRYDAYIKGA